MSITANYFLLPVDSFDVVFKAQWFSTWGPFVCDFSKLQMKFQCDGKEVVLTGLAIPENKIVDDKKIAKELRRKEGALL